MENNFELRIDFKNDVSFKDGQILEEIKSEIQKRIEIQCNSEIKHSDPNKLDGGITWGGENHPKQLSNFHPTFVPYF